MATTFDTKQLGKIFSLVIDAGSEGERANAVTAMVRLFRSNQIHPNDIQFVHNAGGNDDDLVIRMRRVIERLEGEKDTMGREINFFRRTASPESLKAAAKARFIVDHWEDFILVVEKKFSDRDGNLPRNWKKRVAELLGVSNRIIGAWEDRRQTIPDEIMEKLSALPNVEWTEEAEKKRASRPSPRPNIPVDGDGDPHGLKVGRKPSVAPFQWSAYPEVHREVIELFLSGNAGRTEIAKAVGYTDENPNAEGVPNPQQVQTITYNGRPPEFLNASVRTEGPMDWPEAWLIGSTLFIGQKVRSWLLPTVSHFGHENTEGVGITFEVSQADPTLVESFRARYRASFAAKDKARLEALARPSKASKRESAAEEKIERMFKRAGPDGVAFRDLDAIKNLDPNKDGHQRLKTLERSLKIIDTGMRNANGHRKYVHASFRDRWFDEWKIATEKFKSEGLIPEESTKIELSEITSLQRAYIREWVVEGLSEREIRKRFQRYSRRLISVDDLKTVIGEIKFASLRQPVDA